MPQNNKSTAKSPFTPKPVVYAAWGLLAAALVAHFVPALEAVALVLYAVGLIALCFLALTAPKKGTIAVPRVFLPMLAAAFLIVGCQIGMRPDESPLVWRSILLALILLIPLMISGETSRCRHQPGQICRAGVHRRRGAVDELRVLADCDELGV